MPYSIEFSIRPVNKNLHGLLDEKVLEGNNDFSFAAAKPKAFRINLTITSYRNSPLLKKIKAFVAITPLQNVLNWLKESHSDNDFVGIDQYHEIV